ncbi:MAG: glutathione S-transferase [Hyphomicrobiales bacterium]|nr:glutathione S-transferase [Hyphomicrobiales bacterium]
MSDQSLPIFYSFRRCPYAMRARMALVGAQQRVQLREILLRDKPAHMVEVSPKATVPVMVLEDEQVLDESLDIMLWALKRNDPEKWLQPEQGNLDAMLALITEIDGDFKHHLDHYKYATRHVGDGQDPVAYAEKHRAAALAILAQLESRLEANRYLFGNRIALADVAIAPFIRQFANTDITWFNAQELPKLQAWLQTFLADDLFTGIMTKFPQWQTNDPQEIFPAA